MIIQVPAGGLDDNFSYLAFAEATRDGFIVDPCGDTDKLLAAARAQGVKVLQVFNTHGHHDHTEGNAAVLAVTGAQLAVHRADAGGAGGALLLTGGERIVVGDSAVEVIHTPGHTAGSVCLRFQEGLFTGDTLFVDYCGFAREPRVLYQSLLKLRELPDELIVYSGHNYGATPTATLGHEKIHNPYLAARNIDEFLARHREMS